MAVIPVTSKMVNKLIDDPAVSAFVYDSRFKSWAKLIATRGDINLGKSNGYSLTGAWIDWGKSVALTPGQFAVLAAESGSRNDHPYHYALIGVDADDRPHVIRDEAIKAATAEAIVPDAQRAKAANSALYRIALYCALQIDAALPEVERGHKEAAEVETARKAIAALTEEQRQTLFAEFAPVATGGYRFGGR
jgi:hypothetical protein